MKRIEYRDFTEGDIFFLKDLCNKLMKFQADQADMRKDILESMNFENRLAPDYASTKEKYMAVAYDENTPVGFAFAALGTLTEEGVNAKPPWADTLTGKSFYPDGYEVPRKIGTFKLLYVEKDYRGLGIGEKLTDMAMEWLESSKADDLWVYVANGNEKVGRFYERYGFTLSHIVFDGFIEAYKKRIK